MRRPWSPPRHAQRRLCRRRAQVLSPTLAGADAPSAGFGLTELGCRHESWCHSRSGRQLSLSRADPAHWSGRWARSARSRAVRLRRIEMAQVAPIPFQIRGLWGEMRSDSTLPPHTRLWARSPSTYCEPCQLGRHRLRPFGRLARALWRGGRWEGQILRGTWRDAPQRRQRALWRGAQQESCGEPTRYGVMSAVVAMLSSLGPPKPHIARCRRGRCRLLLVEPAA